MNGWISRDKFPKTIIYQANGNDPARDIPDLYAKCIKDGFSFVDRRALNADIGTVVQFITGMVDGLYVRNSSAVDCLVGLHFAMAKGYEIYQDIDISKPQSGKGGSDEYKGYYLAIRK